MSTEPLNSLLTEGEEIEYGPYGPVGTKNNGHMTVRWSKEIGSLALALSQAQLNFKPIKKQVENSFYSTEKRKAMYADLAAIIEATQKALAEQGLVIIQAPVAKDEAMQAGVVSRMIHSSGQWHEVELLLPAKAIAKRWKDGVQVEYVKFDAQTIGSATTYARRYTYQDHIGVAAEEDTDGNDIGEAATGSREAQKAVAQRKIEKAVDSGKTAALFYSFDDAKQLGYITGDLKLIEANVELLRAKGTWSVKEKAFITNANGLEDCKWELEQRGVPFMPLKGTEMTAALQESIAQAKANKKDA